VAAYSRVTPVSRLVMSWLLDNLYGEHLIRTPVCDVARELCVELDALIIRANRGVSPLIVSANSRPRLPARIRLIPPDELHRFLSQRKPSTVCERALYGILVPVRDERLRRA
jgi:hypothetical protein